MHVFLNGVTVTEDDASGKAVVTISVEPQADHYPEVEEVLARAWTMLAEAITEQKAGATAQNAPVNEDESATRPAGSGAWWSE
jgi:hypothetical protein